METMDDSLLCAIQESNIEETSCAAALFLGRAMLYLHEECERRNREAMAVGAAFSAPVRIMARDDWDAARILCSLRELVREVGRSYTSGTVMRGEF